jgi:hypothetical protein
VYLEVNFQSAIFCLQGGGQFKKQIAQLFTFAHDHREKVFERFLHWVMPLEQGIPGVITLGWPLVGTYFGKAPLLKCYPTFKNIN